MDLGRVTGSVWATQKADSLSKYKLLTVKILNNEGDRYVVAADTLGAGIGETVVLVGGSGARICEGMNQPPLDATIVAIVDESAGI
ncbi:MAG: EutN/CcmL family microcompartment protein [Hornefia sp.]|nr:EutN/CcmL family microcompartment protein [Hornefia sp.]